MENKKSEHTEQCCLIDWCKCNEHKYPALANIFAVPNGSKLPYTRTQQGKVWSGQRWKLVKEGMKSGVPDLFLAWPMQGYSGMFIEMKYGKNKPSDEQLNWIARLDNAGYHVVVCYSFEEAKEKILDYINLKQ